MRTAIAVIIMLFILMACESDYTPEKEKATSNKKYTVEKLFTVDGINVYRFHDYGHIIYFTDRTGDIKYDYNVYNGKVIQTSTVQTMCNGK